MVAIINTSTVTPRNLTSVQPSQGASATSQANATNPNGSFSFDGGTVNPSQTATEANDQLMKEIGSESSSFNPATALASNTTVMSNGDIVDTDTNTTVGVDGARADMARRQTGAVQTAPVPDGYSTSGGNKQPYAARQEFERA